MADDAAPDEIETPASPKRTAAYKSIILDIFQRFYNNGDTEFEFHRDDIAVAVERTGVKSPKNPGDVIYAFRHRTALPKPILDTQPDGLYWLILGAGDAQYRFRLSRLSHLVPTPGLMIRKIPDATPGIINQHALTQEQALLAKVRYNRLVDIFLGITAYSLQNHLRTKIVNYGQIEIDELYIGVDSNAAQYIVPVQAKGGNDKLGVIQTIQDVTFCRVGNSAGNKYENLIPRAVSTQFMSDDVIAMFELVFDGSDVSIVQEKHYRLVDASEVTLAELKLYSQG
ncbi:endonuclease [Sphingopyxis sp. CCNWLW253]|uniref:endonuclease n=1 Tax=unclassified Sphingopyxis TaxID=2614943 RepID=UPI0030130193